LVKRPIAITVGVIFVATCIGIGLMLKGSADSSGIADGDAFGADEGSYEISMPTVRAGEDVWYIAPALTNHSSKKVTLEDIQPGTLPEGITFVETRLFDKDVFIAGVPLSWDTGGGSAYDPSTKASNAVQGYMLLAGQSLPDNRLIYLHLRATSSTRPLAAKGVKVVYRQGGREYSQILGATLTLTKPLKSK
jgi:hypothetical protein